MFSEYHNRRKSLNNEIDCIDEVLAAYRKKTVPEKRSMQSD